MYTKHLFKALLYTPVLIHLLDINVKFLCLSGTNHNTDIKSASKIRLVSAGKVKIISTSLKELQNYDQNFFIPSQK